MISCKPICFLLSLLCLALWPVATHARSPELMDAYNRYLELRKQGYYQKAVPFAKEALQLGEEEYGPDDPTTSILINNLATLYDAQGRYSEAEPLHKRSLAIREKSLDPEHPDVAASLNNLARHYDAQGRYAESAPSLHRKIRSSEGLLTPELAKRRPIQAFLTTTAYVRTPDNAPD